MSDQNTIPFHWKIVTALAIALSVWLAGYTLWAAAQAVVRLGGSCASEAHLSDLCDPYLPGVPGKEGR